MARTIKIDNVLQKRFSKIDKKKTKEGTRELKVYFLIVCEGEKTEPNYFKSFPLNVGCFVYDLTFDGGGINTKKVVERAIELRDSSSQKYDRVWAVFDKDSFPMNRFNGAISKADANNIRCAWSNEAFELWYLLHFYNRNTPMSRKEYKLAIEKAINEKLKGKKGGKTNPFKYSKNSTEMYSILQKHGNQAQAIIWAIDIESQHIGENYSLYNPCTKVYSLVKELNGDSQILNTEIIEKYNKGE
ncbi:MAG: RloB family protein [Bacteroidales bacterium]|nr:RloB family protein [Bacteroidales bacterium]MCF8458431.1 RloB family protein [Bacteroidales bacterium]